MAEDIPEGSVVAMLETSTSAVADDFLLHGTFPVLPGTYPRADAMAPFTVLDYDGTPLETQTQIVSRYPRAADGADVVEVIARVRRDPSLPLGSRGTYRVLNDPHLPHPSPGAPGIEDLRNGPGGVAQAVKNLLDDPTSVRVSATDCFGNEYVCNPLDGSGNMRLLRAGEVQTELRVYQVLLPNPPVSGSNGTLPHLFGVHAYVSSFDDEEMLELDLRFHNGHSGRDPSTTLDDPLDKVYFEKIELTVPAGWMVTQEYQDPFFGPAYTNGAGETVYPVVKPNADGSLHVMRWQGQFHRRLMLSTPAASARAKSFQDSKGLGFARRGTDPVEGYRYWSWWNPFTDRYFPQSVQLPILSHIPNGALHNDLTGRQQTLQSHLVNGTNGGGYPFDSSVQGWSHPYGSAYGGMASGLEIHLFDGLKTAENASLPGIRLFSGLHRMHTDRHPTAFYDADGEPTSVERWLIRAGGGMDYLPFKHYITPTLEANDPFGFDQAPQFQIQHVVGTGRQPAYEADHFFWDPHDYQHFVRYTRSAKVLAWLRNDSIAKDDLRMQANNVRLSYHPYFNNSFGGAQGTGMRTDMDYVNQHPRSGFTFGRGEAWGLDCAAAAYATADPAWRAAARPWFDQVVQLLNNGQAGCSGFIQANVSGRFENGQFRSRQTIEQVITENALVGVLESVYRGDHAGYTSMLTTILRRSLLGLVSEMAWFTGEPSPWTFTAVGLADPSTPVWCGRGQIPPNGWEAVHESYQIWSSLGFGYDFTGSSVFLGKASTLLGGGDPLTELEIDGLNNLENRAALLAALQRLNGDL